MSTTRPSLIHRVRDPKASSSWAEFQEIYEPLLIGYVQAQGVSRDDVGDMVQETFLRLLRALPQFKLDHRRGQFRTWLYQITRSVVIDHFRIKAGRDKRLKEWWERFGKHLAAQEQPGEDWNQAMRQRVLEVAHQQVQKRTNPKCWYCYKQRLRRGRPGADIARELQIDLNTVYVYCARVLKKVIAVCHHVAEEAEDE
jgi:RNA polymerase sigma-70 factor (ECF subfamily)